MSRLLLAAPALILTASLAQGQASPTPPRRVAASSFATVEVHVNSRPIGRRWYDEDAGLTGPARIAISYGQPHARGRKIVGGLIPTDTVWRFGANTATTLHSDVDLTIGNLQIPRGDYSLFLVHSGDGGAWELIVNTGTAQWGTDRVATKDMGKVTLNPKMMRDNEESLTMYLVPDSPDPSSGYAKLSGVLRIRWGIFDLSAPWTVKE